MQAFARIMSSKQVYVLIIYKGEIDEILVWTKMKQRWTNGVLQVTRLSTHKTVVWRNGWHLSCISFNKIWDLPLETKVASVCTVYGRLVKDHVYSCSGLHQWSKLQLPKDESRAGILLHILENHRGLYWLSKSKCKHHNRKPKNKIRFTQTKTSSIPPQNGRSKYDQAFRNHQNFEDSHTWYTICSHIYCFAKQCGRF